MTARLLSQRSWSRNRATTPMTRWYVETYPMGLPKDNVEDTYRAVQLTILELATMETRYHPCHPMLRLGPLFHPQLHIGGEHGHHRGLPRDHIHAGSAAHGIPSMWSGSGWNLDCPDGTRLGKETSVCLWAYSDDHQLHLGWSKWS